MSELFMTKFQTFPRPRPTIHILRQAIPGMYDNHGAFYNYTTRDF